MLGMEFERVQASLRAAEVCLEQGLLDSAVNRAYFALFQAAVWALESRGIRRRKLVPASFAGALPSVMHLRHIADYQQPGVSQLQAERAVRRAREFVTLLQREVFDGPQTDHR
jgi:uncharacterized protein (UPF0332 family)